ncbi:MAG: hypothetical protein FWF47_08405 [Clostridia bacterium]|nr:hypothetical protein [Clostridia bacterium]
MGCINHPSKETVSSLFGGLCKTCAEQVKAAQATVNRHVDPKECFVTYVDNKTGWESFTKRDPRKNTGCAHWVAHQLGLKGSFSGSSCAAGYLIKVPDVIRGARKIDHKTEEVKAGDIWVNKDNTHTGLVIKVESSGKMEDGKEAEAPKILIQHCSSGQGGVVSNYYPTYLKNGSFYRR